MVSVYHAAQPKFVNLTAPDKGMSALKAAYNPKLDPYFSVATVPPYTHYTPEQLISCKGP
jgi:hypothetical protein